MKNKILIFALAVCLVVVGAVVVVSAYEINNAPCNHNDYEFLDHKCEEYYDDTGYMPCHVQRVQCNVCDLQWQIGVAVDYEYLDCDQEACGYTATCNSCGEDWVYVKNHNFVNGVCTLCAYECEHAFGDDFKCDFCDLYDCGHNNLVYKAFQYNDLQHQVAPCCGTCGILYDVGVYENHSFYNGKCSCGLEVCTHDAVYNETVGKGSSDGHFVYQSCSICGDEMGDYFQAHDDKIDTYNTYVFSSIIDHIVEKRCEDCGEVISTSNDPHIIRNGECLFCDYVCQHSWSNGVCTICHKLCAHNVTYRLFEGGKYGLSDEYYCTICGISHVRFNSLYGNINYYKRANYVGAWNDKLSGVQVDFTGNIVSAYQRFTVNDFPYNSSATITLVGGFQFTERVNLIKNSRYAVLRVRYSDVELLELDLYTSKSENKNVPSDKMSAFRPIKLQGVPEGEFVNLVIDLQDFSPKVTNYDIKSTDTYSHMRALLCAVFENANGYIDIEYFALCDNLAEVDKCVSYSYDNFYDSYYLYDNSKWKNVTFTHDYSKNSSGSLPNNCISCGWHCPHKDWHYVCHTSTTYHRIYKKCEFCPWDYDWTAKIPHIFTGNVNDCTEPLCNYHCDHVFVGTSCGKCGWSCDHRYEKGHIKCVDCSNIVFINDSQNVENGFANLIGSIYDGQATIFFSMLDYDIWGVNLAGIFISLVAIGISIFVLKKVL